MSSYGSDDFNFSALNDYSPWGTPNRTSTPILTAAGVGTSAEHSSFTAVVTADTAPSQCLDRRSRHSWLGCITDQRHGGCRQCWISVALQRHSGCRGTQDNIRHTFGTRCSRRETTETRPASKYTDVLQ